MVSRAAPSRPSRCNAPPTGETTRGKEGGDAQTSLVATCMLCSGSQRHGTRWGDVTLGRKLRGPRREKGASSRLDGRPGRLLRSAARAAEEEEKPRRLPTATREDRHERKNGASQRGAGPTQLERAPYDPAAARQM
ncbi:unnamed protein product [Prorocentrum cordatum]|uniref:Uncharacterized protein n=1 Tax=Prorocentrum cordatum TaxID=2364126 RepID=A0ABN9TZK0_9DINO|nr:unnamed protein product [Polarella glacialis]